MKPPDKELVILAGETTWLPVIVQIASGIDTIVMREHGPLGEVIGEKLWVCQQEERLPSGQRVFRELLPPAVPEKSEQPIFDELIIKKPLPFTFHDS